MNEFKQWYKKAKLRYSEESLEKFAFLMNTEMPIIEKNDMLPETYQEWEDCYNAFLNATKISESREIKH